MDAPVSIVDTPLYLRSVRGAASFSAAFSRNPEERSLFYITCSEKSPGGIGKRLHREFRFLTAHETYPGHHLLDHVRRSLQNPIRRQIESALFYEGWASYAESLLEEHEYLRDPMDHLILHKRNLWRAARCMIDVGLTSGTMEMEEALSLLERTGFGRTESRDQIRRFRLNPGYQLCYTLGCHAILKLRERYGTLLSNERFHRELLGGGEIPFSLIEKRLERLAGEGKR
jgi:uncharacterized protein (DUF885 family)